MGINEIIMYIMMFFMLIAAVIVDLAKRMLEQKASGINMTR